MSEKIYVIGHKNPDLDSVAAAITYAYYKNETLKTDKYVPAIANDINKETEYILEKFGFDKPEMIDGKGKKLLLVDHNEFSQSVDGVEEAEIIEVFDHHKVNFKYNEPIAFTVKAYGASCTILAELFFDNNVRVSKELASLMLSAILVDTVITKSPTCTPKDLEIIKELAGIAEISDWRDFGMEVFKVRSSVSELSPEEIINSDYKDFNFSSGKFGIGQVETVDLTNFDNLKEDILASLEKMRIDGNYHSVILFLTDIIKEGSLFLVASEDTEKVEEALDAKLENNEVYIPGIISRKKQVSPNFAKVFD